MGRRAELARQTPNRWSPPHARINSRRFREHEGGDRSCVRQSADLSHPNHFTPEKRQL